MSLKAVILVGGAQKGTRFRPLSFQVPKPLFPIAGIPLVEQHIDQLCTLSNLSEIILLGFYKKEEFNEFITKTEKEYKIPIKYYEENESLGTCGGILSYKDKILDKDTEGIFVLNADICGDLPIYEMVQFLEEQPNKDGLILTTEATRDQSINFGCVVADENGSVLHYVEKPTTFVSTRISCGIYLLRPSIFKVIENIRNSYGYEQIWFETDIFPEMASNDSLCALHTQRWWSQTKTAGAALYANRHYLRLYKERHSKRLASKDKGCCIIEGDVFIDPTATIDPTAKIGPNVSIGANVSIGPGVRIKESIVLSDSIIGQHSCILHSIIGWGSQVGNWARVEGTSIAPNPNIPFAKLDNKDLFNNDGRLNPSLTILGSGVRVADESVVLNCVVLPFKELSSSFKNQIIL
uniref:NTP_transferase domain-containing protein n=1 Tax=Parastrongyloides trichosuri TaxID=131310 RepID=A0A0N4ZCY2_PARTI